MAPPSLLSEPTSGADQQWLFTQEMIDNSPSVLGGIPRKMEVHYRAKAVQRMFAYKDHLAIPQLVINTAAAYMHRFYMRKTMQAHPWEMISAAAIFLAAKVEENPRRMREVTSITCDLAAGKEPLRDSTGKLVVDDNRPSFQETRKKILYFEEVLNHTLCFDLTIRQPQFALIKGSRLVWKNEQAVATKVASVGWALINDTLYTTLQLLHRPNVIAAAALLFACMQLDVPVPGIPQVIDPLLLELAREEGEEPELEVYWLELFDVTPEEVKDALERMVKAYERAESEYVRREAKRTGEDAIAAALLLEPVPIKAPPPPPTADPTPILPASAESTTPKAPSSTTPLPVIPSTTASEPAPPALAGPPAPATPPLRPTDLPPPAHLPPPTVTLPSPQAPSTKMDVDPPEMPPPTLIVAPAPARTNATSDMDVGGETTDSEASFPVGMSGGRSLLGNDTEMSMGVQPFAFPSSQGSQQG